MRKRFIFGLAGAAAMATGILAFAITPKENIETRAGTTEYSMSITVDNYVDEVAEGCNYRTKTEVTKEDFDIKLFYAYGDLSTSQNEDGYLVKATSQYYGCFGFEFNFVGPGTLTRVTAYGEFDTAETREIELAPQYHSNEDDNYTVYNADYLNINIKKITIYYTC